MLSPHGAQGPSVAWALGGGPNRTIAARPCGTHFVNGDMAYGATKDANRWFYGLVAVGLGLITILIALGIVVKQFKDPADVGAVLGLIVSPVATIVAAYFGVQAGSAGKEAADKNAKEANDKAIALASVADPGAAQAALQAL